MRFELKTVSGLAIAAAVAFASSNAANAAGSPKGIWYDHNGRGAVEIADCENGPGLCGYVVHVKQKKNADRCGMQILGNVTSNGGGWIYSPSRGKKYAVRLGSLDDSHLQVVGNANSRLFSKTFTWERASGDIELCGKYAKRNGRNTDVANAERVEERAVYPAGKEQKYTGRDEEWGAEPARSGKNGERVEKKVTEILDRLIDRANEGDGVIERKCKFRIPYVDRVVMIPCRDQQ